MATKEAATEALIRVARKEQRVQREKEAIMKVAWNAGLSLGEIADALDTGAKA